MAPPFQKQEYDFRVTRVREAMIAKGLDALIMGDPGNINWICGFDAWSFYTPQMMILDLSNGPIWLGREMDAGAAKFTTYLSSKSIVSYPEELVQRPNAHPSEYLADWMNSAGYGSCLLYTSPSPRDATLSRMPSSA